MSDATPKLGPALRTSIAQNLARALLAAYRLTLSPLIGYNCRHLPTCSQYADEAIERHGFWAGGWMTLARLLRCHPLGTSGLDFVPSALPANSCWYLPWRYGRWRGVNNSPPQPRG
jgi:putative membrane protein insertion efficiency factor